VHTLGGARSQIWEEIFAGWGRVGTWRVGVGNLAVVAGVLRTTTKKWSTFSETPSENPGYAYVHASCKGRYSSRSLSLDASATIIRQHLPVTNTNRLYITW